MSLLTRFVRLPDRGNTHVFTFVVTRSVTRDLHRDVTSKEFCYGYHRWAITFSRAGKVLGVYLVWKNPSEGMKVYIDFSFTLLNREHFSANETFSGRQIKFTFDSPAQGNRRYIPVADLYSRHFTDQHGEFQLELTVSNIRTIYETELKIPSLAGHVLCPTGSTFSLVHSNNVLSQLTAKPCKLETTYFSFGGFDWNVAVSADPSANSNNCSSGSSSVAAGVAPSGVVGVGGTSSAFHLPLSSSSSSSPLANSPRNTDDHTPCDGYSLLSHRKLSNERLDSPGTSVKCPLAIRLRRLTGVDHRSRARYILSVGEPGDRRLNSGVLDDVSDAEGLGSVWCPRLRFSDVAPKNILRVQVEFLSAKTLSESLVTLAPVSTAGTANGGVGVGATCYDRDKQAWYVEPDTHSDTLRIRMVYRDVRNVPRNHIRYMSWSASILRPLTAVVLSNSGVSGAKGNSAGFAVNSNVNSAATAGFDPVPFAQPYYSNYYVQEETDDGLIMESGIPIKELYRPGSQFVNDKLQLLVEIEWDESLLLFQATYHKYDDVTRIHNYQMRKEITALQNENYSLERQLFSYQRSLALAHTRNQPSDETSSSANGDYLTRRDEEHERSYLCRSQSTDTEYA